jgi:hypothetical protein
VSNPHFPKFKSFISTSNIDIHIHGTILSTTIPAAFPFLQRRQIHENRLNDDLREVGPNKYVRGQIGANFSEAGSHHQCAAPQDVCSADKPVQLRAAVSWRRLFCAALNLSPERLLLTFIVIAI